MESIKQNPLKILLVEDQALALKAHRIILERLGYTRSDSAHSGSEAIEKLKNYDVIFMDLNLPDITGIEAATAIRQRENPEKRAYIVALTAHTVTDSLIKQCRAGGIDLVKAKPIHAEEMAEILAQVQERNAIKV